MLLSGRTLNHESQTSQHTLTAALTLPFNRMLPACWRIYLRFGHMLRWESSRVQITDAGERRSLTAPKYSQSSRAPQSTGQTSTRYYRNNHLGLKLSFIISFQSQALMLRRTTSETHGSFLPYLHIHSAWCCPWCWSIHPSISYSILPHRLFPLSGLQNSLAEKLLHMHHISTDIDLTTLSRPALSCLLMWFIPNLEFTPSRTRSSVLFLLAEDSSQFVSETDLLAWTESRRHTWLAWFFFFTRPRNYNPLQKSDLPPQHPKQLSRISGH